MKSVSRKLPWLLVCTLLLGFTLSPAQPARAVAPLPAILYVDKSATGANNGSNCGQCFYHAAGCFSGGHNNQPDLGG